MMTVPGRTATWRKEVGSVRDFRKGARKAFPGKMTFE